MKRAFAIVLLGLALIAQSQAAAPAGKIAGQAVQRRNGTWLGIQLTAGNFRVTFYDRNRHPMPADATSVVLSWAAPKTGTYAPPPVSTQLAPLTDVTAVFTNSYYVAYTRPMNLRIVLTVPPSDPAAASPATETYNLRFTAAN